MNQYEVSHRWAHQSHPHAKTRSMFFEQDTIYSYGHHWPIARIVKLADSGRQVAVIHDLPHTPATNRHTRTVYWAAFRKYGSNSVIKIEQDLFHKIVDEAALAAAVRETLDRALDRAYEERVRRNERAVRDRQSNGAAALSELEIETGRDLDGMSVSCAIRLRNTLLGVPANNFQCGGYRRSGERCGGLLERHPGITAFIVALIDEDPTLITRPSMLMTLISSYTQLA